MAKEWMTKWKGVSKTLQYLIYGIVVAMILGGAFLLYSKPAGYEVLYQNLTPEDSSAVKNELAKSGISYQENGDGTSISVAPTDIGRARMQIANNDVLTHADILTVFDSNSLGLSQSDKDKKYAAALTNQIQHDLESGINGIEKATVKLTIQGEKAFYEKGDENSKASVILQLAGEETLSKKQVRGIQNFIASAVTNLKASDVTIQNSDGEELTGATEENDDSAYGQVLMYNEKTAKNLKKELESSLKEVYKEKFVVNVNTTIDFDEYKKNSETYNDQNKALISKQTENGKTTKTENGTTTEVGTDSNGEVPNYNNQNQDGEATYIQENNKTTENWQPGKVTESVVSKPKISFTSIGLLIDKGKNGHTRSELEGIEQTVAFAAGITDSNNDGVYDNGQVKVTEVDFAKAEKEKVVTAKETFLTKFPLGLLIGGAGVLLFIILLIVWLVIRSKEKKEEAQLLARMSKKEEEHMREVKRHTMLDEAKYQAENNVEKTADYISYMVNRSDD